MQENISEKSNEGEWSGKRREKKVASSFMGQVKGQSQLQKNGV